MGLFDLFSRKPKISGDELLRQRDGEHLRHCVEMEIFHPQYIYLDSKREQQRHHFNFALDWRIHNTDQRDANLYGYYNINFYVKYTEQDPITFVEDFRSYLKAACDKGDARAAFYLAALHECGFMEAPIDWLHEGSGQERDGYTPIDEMGDAHAAEQYHMLAAQRGCSFEAGWKRALELADRCGLAGDRRHLAAVVSATPFGSNYESALRRAFNDDSEFLSFKQFGVGLCMLYGAFGVPGPLFTMCMRKDIYVASGQATGPEAAFTPYGRRLEGTYEEQQQDKIVSNLRIAQNYIIDSANAGNEEARFFAQRLAR